MGELSEVERRVMLELQRAPASTVWKLSNLLGIPSSELSKVLEDLSERGLVIVTGWGWELTAEAHALLRETEASAKAKVGPGVTRLKRVVKVPFPKEVERSKKKIKPFKESGD